MTRADAVDRAQFIRLRRNGMRIEERPQLSSVKVILAADAGMGHLIEVAS